ncbi:MAG TPA: hypothetical protein PK177_11025 [Burkholderiaceae bacterium]|nr:hypothetical protein [Burkholderiaceae bacterium]
MCSKTAIRSVSKAPKQERTERFLSVAVPAGLDPATLSSVGTAVEKALTLMTNVTGVIERADRVAELATELMEPSLELVEERMHRMNTLREVFEAGDWLTAEQLNALQPAPPANKAYPASDWKRRGRIFSVNYGGREYFPRYEFDAFYQPLPIIRQVLAAFGEVADPWRLAAWFHYPSPWLVARDEQGARNIAPKDALDRSAEVVAAAAKRSSSFVA